MRGSKAYTAAARLMARKAREDRMVACSLDNVGGCDFATCVGVVSKQVLTEVKVKRKELARMTRKDRFTVVLVTPPNLVPCC